ncbi:MAG TPA: glycosyltransferase family 4 protein [Pyrinomonadaceae bacterium]|nr:glycosyltransferase family 4 protein [Pyrinomonadaceae bacterium]
MATPKKKSIALLLDSAPGTWTSQEDRHFLLCRELTARGVLPILAYARKLRPEFEAKFRAAGAEVVEANYGKGILDYNRTLKTIVSDHQISAAHIVFFDYFSAIPWLSRLNRVPHIIYEMQNSGAFTAATWKRAALRLRTRVMTKPMTQVIAISQFVRQQLVEAGVDQHKISVRYLGVDTNRFTPDPAARQEWAVRFNINPQEVILSTVSYLRPFKNPHIIVEACGILNQRDVPFRLIVAGGGELLTGLKEQSVSLGISDRAHWLGDWPDPTSLLQASDIFVLASVGEAFGLVLAEAMACGVPVVGSNAGSIPEVVDEGGSGMLARPLDPVSFADKLEQMARDSDLRKRMGTEAVARVRGNFSVERAVAETLRIYEGAINF